jgi:hypothetical protein
MSDPIIIGAVVIILAAMCLLGLLIYKVGTAVAASVGIAANAMGVAGSQAASLRRSIEHAAEPFAPVRNIPCTKCGGTGTVEKESPLWTAIAEALQHHPRHRK